MFSHLSYSSNVFLIQFSVFNCPRRPNLGRDGRTIVLRANHFQVTMPRGYVHHYDINIQPDKCPRKVNREIIETMVSISIICTLMISSPFTFTAI